MILKLDLDLLQKRKDRGGKIIAQCPACSENGGDKSGEHLAVFADGRFACAALAGDSAHRKRIFDLIGRVDYLPMAGQSLAGHSRPTRKPVELLGRIKSDFPADVSGLWDSSPIRCDGTLNESQAFLRLFPDDGVLWIAPSVCESGKPEHARFFRTRTEWQKERFAAPGTRIAPASFKPGSFSRNRGNVAEHIFTVIETDEIGEGKKYASKDEFCSLIRWLRDGCGWHLAAVVDSGGKSLHAWFRHPGQVDLTVLSKYSSALGLDSKFTEPMQPWRLPGVQREKSEKRQQLLYLTSKTAI
jgi:hypothetical protein